MNVLDLFAGIGGFSLGLERAGMNTVAFCESDPYCQKVLRKHWPDVPIWPQIETLKIREHAFIDFVDQAMQLRLREGIDVVCGGWPCQGNSVAGKKLGSEDDRSGLWKEFCRVIKEVSPRWVIAENVANVRNTQLAEVIKDLWKLGYDCEWHIISARSVGANHFRQRLWIIAYPNCSSLRKQSISFKRSKSETESRKPNEENANPNIVRLEGSREFGHAMRPEENKKGEGDNLIHDNTDTKSLFFADSNMPRLWKPFTSEEEASRWWTERTSGFRDWWQIEPGICGMDVDVSKRVDRNGERIRKERIKMLGNSVVPAIPEIIGRMILEYEDRLAVKG